MPAPGRVPQRVGEARVGGVGVAMPFFLWDWAQTLEVPPERMEPWRDFDMRAELAPRHDLPVFL